MVQKASAEPRKVRWTLPAADTSVAAWLDVQQNVSESLRLLIREEIQRNGYTDVAYKPVEQLPRRGRPPKGGSLSSDGTDVTVSRADDAPTSPPAPTLPTFESRFEPEPTTEPAPSAGESDDGADGTQVDMDDIFGHNG